MSPQSRTPTKSTPDCDRPAGKHHRFRRNPGHPQSGRRRCPRDWRRNLGHSRKSATRAVRDNLDSLRTRIRNPPATLRPTAIRDTHNPARRRCLQDRRAPSSRYVRRNSGHGRESTPKCPKCCLINELIPSWVPCLASFLIGHEPGPQSAQSGIPRIH